MGDSNLEWLSKAQYEERNQNYRTVWDLYLKFYTVFLTMNIVGLGVVVQHVKSIEPRWWIVAAFTVQNLLSAGTAFWISRFCTDASNEVERLSSAILSGSDAVEDELRKLLKSSPLPAWLGVYAAWANLISHFALISLWIGVGVYGPLDVLHT